MSGKPDMRQQRTPMPAQRRMWGVRYAPNSVFAKLDKEQRRKYEKWIKALDKDVAEFERWGRTRA